ncbi:hypothetical protein [Aquimarina algicola]|uniref:Uncharacterized protein n=1 Tax=Aquimarina algicola TaxID=2589995 RepID=A0A504JDP8_9FLAO|nr:hypothetical protein [Aquimarina algicola]TPN88947.1 hypothetical protein FHK87_01645 [Aquimarina algicola]
MKILQACTCILVIFLSCSSNDDQNEDQLDNSQDSFVLWRTIDLIATVNGADLDDEVVLRFSDGTVTKDVDNIFSSSIEDLKSKNPDHWGVSRIVDGKLEIDWEENGEYSTFFNSFEIAPVTSSDFKFTDCYKITGGVSTGIGDLEIHSFSIEKVFFGDNGRFSFQSSTAVIGAGGSSASIRPDENGSYTINKYQIELLFDNGNSVVTTFGLDTDDESSFMSIGKDVYYRCK